VVAPEEEEDLDDSIPNELWSELEGLLADFCV